MDQVWERIDKELARRRKTSRQMTPDPPPLWRTFFGLMVNKWLTMVHRLFTIHLNATPNREIRDGPNPLLQHAGR